jgi:hypothetical protein
VHSGERQSDSDGVAPAASHWANALSLKRRMATLCAASAFASASKRAAARSHSNATNRSSRGDVVSAKIGWDRGGAATAATAAASPSRAAGAMASAGGAVMAAGPATMAVHERPSKTVAALRPGSARLPPRVDVRSARPIGDAASSLWWRSAEAARASIPPASPTWAQRQLARGHDPFAKLRQTGPCAACQATFASGCDSWRKSAITSDRGGDRASNWRGAAGDESRWRIEPRALRTTWAMAAMSAPETTPYRLRGTAVGVDGAGRRHPFPLRGSGVRRTRAHRPINKKTGAYVGTTLTPKAKKQRWYLRYGGARCHCWCYNGYQIAIAHEPVQIDRSDRSCWGTRVPALCALNDFHM